MSWIIPRALARALAGGLLISAAVFGAGTLFDAVYPMSCAPSTTTSPPASTPT